MENIREGIILNIKYMATNIKSIFCSKTFWVAVIQGVVGILTVVGTQVPDIGWILIAKSVLDVLLRAITTQPVSI